MIPFGGQAGMEGLLMDNNTDILIYQTEDGNTKIDVKLENGTVWMTQKAIAEL